MAQSTGHFRVPKPLTFKTRQLQNLSCKNEFYLQENEEKQKHLISYQQLRTKHRFETDAWGNSDVAYHVRNLPGSAVRLSHYFFLSVFGEKKWGIASVYGQTSAWIWSAFSFYVSCCTSWWWEKACSRVLDLTRPLPSARTASSQAFSVNAFRWLPRDRINA